MKKTNEENAMLLLEHIKTAVDAYIALQNNVSTDSSEYQAFLKRFYELVNYKI